MNAALLAFQRKSVPTTVELIIFGTWPETRDTSTRTTVQSPLGEVTFLLVGRLREFETKRSAPVLVATAVMSHGPSMFGFDQVSATEPLLFNTMRHPAGLRLGRAPPFPAGRLPTTTRHHSARRARS